LVKLIRRKIIKIVATRCHILKLTFTKFDFSWGWIKGGLLLREGGEKTGRERQGKGKGGKETYFYGEGTGGWYGGKGRVSPIKPTKQTSPMIEIFFLVYSTNVTTLLFRGSRTTIPCYFELEFTFM